MKFIREKGKYIYYKIKQSCADYRVTVIIVELLTLYTMSSLVWDDLNLKYSSLVTDFLFHDWGILAFLMLFILASMLIESLFPYVKQETNVKIARIIGFLFGIAITDVIMWG